MSEMVKQWFRDLYMQALEETRAAIGNERIWQNGADSDEEIEMHGKNIEYLEEYAELLRAKLDMLEKE